jgi:hypothetical protein
MSGKLLPHTLSLFVPLVASCCLCLAVTQTQAEETIERVKPDPDAHRDNNLEIHYRNLQRPDEAIWLNANDQPFLGLYQLQRSMTPQGGALIVHGNGQTADWPELLQEARHYLPDVGWSTLSIAVPTQIGSPLPKRTLEPVPETVDIKNDLTDVMMARINTALAYLNEQGNENIVFIGYGTGAAWITQFVSTQLTAENNTGYALIIIDSQLPDNQPPIQLDQQLAALTIPVLDVWFDARTGSPWQAKMRQAAMNRAQRVQYQQILETRAGDRFSRGPSRMTRRVWGWLKSFSKEREMELAAAETEDQNPAMQTGAIPGALRSEQVLRQR